MYFVLFLLFGLGVGAAARWISPSDVRGGWVTSMSIGVAGALFGGVLGRVVGLYGSAQPAGFLLSVVGAVLLVGAYHSLARHHPCVRGIGDAEVGRGKARPKTDSLGPGLGRIHSSPSKRVV